MRPCWPISLTTICGALRPRRCARRGSSRPSATRLQGRCSRGWDSSLKPARKERSQLERSRHYLRSNTFESKAIWVMNPWGLLFPLGRWDPERLPRCNAAMLLVLTYHRIVENVSAVRDFFDVPRAELDEHLRAAKQIWGGAASPAEIQKEQKEGSHARTGFLVTFDDGTTDHYFAAAPVWSATGGCGDFFRQYGSTGCRRLSHFGAVPRAADPGPCNREPRARPQTAGRPSGRRATQLTG